MILNKKQREVLKAIKEEQPKIIILFGAKRAGKTFLSLLLFLSHIAKYESEGLSFVIGGVSASAIRRNVLDELELVLQQEIQLDKSSSFQLFGNTVYCIDGAMASSWKKARGFTSAGAYLNEGTALHDTFVKEIISRGSYKGARVIIDTNTENPAHPIKKDYIDKSGELLSTGRVNISSFNFTLFDNEMLDREYVESIIKATPSGAFTDRDIYGRWVAREGAVYSDFGEHNYIYRKEIEGMEFDRLVVGVDWGYEHQGTMVVLGFKKGKYFLLEEHTQQHKDIEYWVGVATDIQKRWQLYGVLPYFCDSARPEYVVRLTEEGLNAMNANKSIIEGVAFVASLMKNEKLFVVREAINLFEKQVNEYVWDKNNDKPKKENDDVLDGVRYAIYSDYIMNRNSEEDYGERIKAIRTFGL